MPTIETPQTPVEKPEFSLEQFEPDVFWQQHGRKVMWAIAGALALGLVIYLVQLQNAQKAEAAASRLAAAQTVTALDQIIRENAGQDIAAQAMLRQADLQFRDGKYTEAAAVYQQFLAAFPQHLFADSARLGLAAVLEAQGKYEEAKQQYDILAGKTRAYTATAARIGVARCTELLGQRKEARHLYEELLPVVQGTAWQNTVYLRWTVLGRDLPKDTPAPVVSSNAPPTATGSH